MEIKDNSLLPTALLIVFITLKLCHVITWSWWWVLSPMWLPLVIVLLTVFLKVLLD